MSKSLNDISSTGEEAEDLGDDGTLENFLNFFPSCSSNVSSHPAELNSTVSSAESGSSANVSERDTLRDQLCSMFGVIHQAIATMEKSETADVKEFTNEASGVGESKNREVTFQTSDESIPVNKTLKQVKTLMESTASRSDNEAECSRAFESMLNTIKDAVNIAQEVTGNSVEDFTDTIGEGSSFTSLVHLDRTLQSEENEAECSTAFESMLNTIKDAVNIAQEVTGNSVEDFTDTIVGEGSSSTSLGHLDRTLQSENSKIRTNESETIYSLQRKASQTVNISNQEELEIDRSLVSSIRITDILEDIHVVDDEIKEMIESMLETQETTGQLSSSLQQSLAALRKQGHYDTCEGDCLKQEVKSFADDITVDITAWNTFRRKVTFYKKYILQHSLISSSIYCDYNRVQEIRFRMERLRAKMKESRNCRNYKDEDFLKVNEKTRTFVRNARVITERGTPNPRNSPGRKRVCK